MLHIHPREIPRKIEVKRLGIVPEPRQAEDRGIPIEPIAGKTSMRTRPETRTRAKSSRLAPPRLWFGPPRTRTDRQPSGDLIPLPRPGVNGLPRPIFTIIDLPLGRSGPINLWPDVPQQIRSTAEELRVSEPGPLEVVERLRL